MEKNKKNKLVCIFVFSLIISFFTLGFTFAGSSGTLNVTAKITPNVVGISVPNNLTFYNITSGYESEREIIELNNTGNVDISVSVSLENSYNGTLFTNLEFSNSSSTNHENFSNFFVIIKKPSTLVGEKSKNIYAYLNLENYNETFSSAQNFSANVIFTAVET